MRQEPKTFFRLSGQWVRDRARVIVCKPLSETHLPHIAGAIYRSDEITSAKRNFTSEDAKNFAKMTMKFRLIQRKCAGALAKFRDERSLNFRENKGRNSANLAFNTLAHHCNYSTITSILALTITLGDTRSSKFQSRTRLTRNRFRTR